MFKIRLIRCALLFLIGGFIYCIIELVSRGRSHISMLIAGGLSFVLIGRLNKRRQMSLVGQMFLGGIIITVIEFITGLIVNVWLGLGVWDYSDMPYNILGQVCLLFSNLWFLISVVVIVLDDYIRYWFMGEEKPKYKIF